MIHWSRAASWRSVASHSSFGVRCHSGRQKSWSKRKSGSPVMACNRLASVDLPEPGPPMTSTRFIKELQPVKLTPIWRLVASKKYAVNGVQKVRG